MGPALTALEILYEALAAPSGIGLVVQVSDFQVCRARLYKARADAQDPDLGPLQIRQSPTGESELWIVKSGQVPKEAS